MWMKATEGADGTVFYIDRDSIKKEGALIRVWELQDLKAKGPLEEKSRRVLVEYDSKNERRRVLSFSFHGESMGAGVTLKSDQTPGNTERNGIKKKRLAMRVQRMMIPDYFLRKIGVCTRIALLNTIIHYL